LSGWFEAEVSSAHPFAEPMYSIFHDPDHYQWIKKDLESHLVNVPEYLDITFNFHVTQYSPVEGTLLEKVATLTRIATSTQNEPAITGETSSSEGYNSSSPAESINEKEQDLDNKYRSDEGKDGLVHWHQGRANLVHVLQQAVEAAHGPVSVNGKPKTLCTIHGYNSCCVAYSLWSLHFTEQRAKGGSNCIESQTDPCQRSSSYRISL
jgi:hypothetical protein